MQLNNIKDLKQPPISNKNNNKCINNRNNNNIINNKTKLNQKKI